MRSVPDPKGQVTDLTVSLIFLFVCHVLPEHGAWQKWRSVTCPCGSAFNWCCNHFSNFLLQSPLQLSLIHWQQRKLLTWTTDTMNSMHTYLHWVWQKKSLQYA